MKAQIDLLPREGQELPSPYRVHVSTYRGLQRENGHCEEWTPMEAWLYHLLPLLEEE
jgi:hypothetical protein